MLQRLVLYIYISLPSADEDLYFTSAASTVDIYDARCLIRDTQHKLLYDDDNGMQNIFAYKYTSIKHWFDAYIFCLQVPSCTACMLLLLLQTAHRTITHPLLYIYDEPHYIYSTVYIYIRTQHTHIYTAHKHTYTRHT